MKNKLKILIIILVPILIGALLFCIETDKITNIKNAQSIKFNNAEELDEEDISNYTDAYKKWLELSDEEKAKIGVIPRKYNVPLDMVYERIEQENSIGKKLKSLFNLGDLEGENLPSSFILTGEDTNKDGITDEKDIKVDSYGGINIRVEDQADSSLCWAFSAIKCLETNLALNTDVEYDFSERHLDYMQSDLLIDIWREQDSGGTFEMFENYINLEDGPVLETEVPFNSEYTTISELEYLESLLQRVDVDEEDFVYMPSINKSTTHYTDEELKTFRTIVKEHIMNNGTLSASIYTDGLYSTIDMKSPVLNYQSNHIANHAITIIGWDDNFSKENFPEFCKPNNDGAYIALNSWGEEWGHCGIFYISYEDKLIEESMSGVSNAKILDLLDIYIEKEPNNINYCSGDTFNTDGMIVKAIYRNEEKEITNYTINPEIIKADTENITISYMEGSTTKSTIQKINIYDYKENLEEEASLYYDNTNRIMFISGKGIPQINFNNYDLKLMVLEDGIKGISSSDGSNLSQLDRIYILDKECEISNIPNISDDTTVYCHKDSTAQEYCKTNNIKYYSYDNYYKCGEKAYAFLNKTAKRLIVSGVGEIYEYTLNKIPWRQESGYINSIEIDNDITNISNKLFAENSNIEELKLGNNVTRIGNHAFYNCSNLSKVELNNGLQNIGRCVFYNCTNLKKIDIPESVSEIEDYCFYNCINLIDVKFPAKTTNIANSMFENCRALKEIELPDEIGFFGSRAFMNCTSLERIKIPKEMYSMGNWTFSNCVNLREVDFGDSSPDNIGDVTFYGCSNLESFIMPDTVTSISQGVFGKCTSLKILQFSHGLSRLWSAVAQNCSALEEISIPYGIKIIGDFNFLGGTNLKKVILPCGLEKIGSMNFVNCNNLQYLIIPDSVSISEEIDLLGECSSNPTIYCKSNSSIMEYAINNNINYVIDDTKPTLEVTQEKVENGATIISITATDDNETVGLSDYPYSFDGGETWQPEPYIEISGNAKIIPCARDAVGNIATQVITQWDISETDNDNVKAVLNEQTGTLTIFGNGNMKNWSGSEEVVWNGIKDKITNVVIEEGVTNIGKYAFYNCGNLTSVNIPNGVTNIGEYAFRGCSGLTSIEIPNGVTSIEGWVFHKCSKLENITIPETVSSIGEAALSDCTKLEEISVNENNQYYTSVNGVLFNEEGTEILQYPAGRSGEEYTIPDDVENIGYASFEGCSSLKSVIIPDSVETIKLYAFSKCSSLTSIEIPVKVINIGNYAFSGCSNLTSIKIPNTVENIGNNAFAGCTSLTIYCRSNSKAKGHAVKNDIEYNEFNPYITSVEGNATEWTKENVTLTVTAVDELYGLADEAYSFDGGKKWQVENTKEYSENTEGIEIQVKAKDGAVTSAEDIDITNIMKPVNIKITTNPSKIEYNPGEDFEEKGMVVTLVYNNETEEEITNYTVINGENLTCNSQVEIQYNENPEIRTVVSITVDHTEVIDEVVNPTCTEEGYTTYRCENCDYSYREEIAAIDHSYEEVITNPTCTEQGYTTHTCSNCNNSYKDTYTEATDHSYDETITEEAECEEAGEKTYACTNCDYSYTEEIPATGHAYSSVVTDPTCTEKGYTTHTCTSCNDSYVDTDTNALGHSFTNYVSNNDATCTEDGTKTAKCDRCEEEDTLADEGSKTGHSYNNVVIPPRCTEKGYTRHICARCYDNYVDTYTDALGHKFTNYTSNNDATCTEDGTKTAKCERCERPSTIADEGSKKGHNYKDGKCTLCGQEEPKIKLESDVYTIKEGKIKGISPKTTIKEFLSNIDTNDETVEIYKGETKITDKSQKIGTGMKIIVSSDVEYTAIVRGDINGDGQIKLSDLSKLKLYIIGKATLQGVSEEAADITLDGKIKLSDLSKMKLVLIGKEEL